MLNFDPTVIDIDTNSIDEPFEYLDSYFNQIKNINIADFNFDIFEKNINELTDDEFEQLWDEKIKPLLIEIDENYLTVDLDEFEISDTETKRLMFIEYVKFLMDTLPYKIVFAKLIKKPFEGITELDNRLSTIDLPKKLASMVRDTVTVIKNTYNLIQNTIDANKRVKQEYKYRAQMLESVINHEIKMIKYFADLLLDTENDKLKKLILKYYENEVF